MLGLEMLGLEVVGLEVVGLEMLGSGMSCSSEMEVGVEFVSRS